MKAMILAGGLSTRLYPLTKQVPKPLVPVAGEPNAVHVIRYLKNYGFDEIAINIFYLPDAIREALGDGSRFGVRLEYLHERELMGSAGALKQMEAYFADSEHFVVVGCDDLTDLPLDALLAQHRANDAVATIGLVPRERVDQYGVVVLDERERIVGFQEKPSVGTERSRLVNTGIYAFSRAIFNQIPAATFYDFGKQVFPALESARAPFFGFRAPDAYWTDIGTPEEYRRATYDVLEGRFVPIGARPVGVSDEAIVAAGARVEGKVWIGAGARIEGGAHVVGPTVVGVGASVGRDAVVERSVLWDRAAIGAGSRLRDALVGLDYRVAAGSELIACSVANE